MTVLARISRWLPASLVNRVALLLAVALVLLQLLSWPVYLREQARSATDVFERDTLERIINIVTRFEKISDRERRELLPLLNNPSLNIELLFADARVAAVDTATRNKVFLRDPLLSNLSLRINLPVEIDDVPEQQVLPDLFPSQKKIAIWVQLPDRQWLRFITASSLPAMGWIMHLSAQYALVCLGLVLFAWWAARQITRPLHLFSEAAQRLGTDVNAPPMPELGGEELRRATHAFNTMQSRLQRYLADRNHMLASISHDLRTLLTRLRLRIDFIENPQQLEKAEQDILAMDSMLASALALVRDDTGEEPKSRVDLVQLLQMFCDDYTDLGHRVIYQGPDKCLIDCHRVALTRALSNLLDNACRYGSEVICSVAQQDAQVLVSVSDNGSGIAPADFERVFEPFVRLDAARTQQGSHAGLGLAIVRAVARAHGGDVTLANRNGGGLIVALQIPL